MPPGHKLLKQTKISTVLAAFFSFFLVLCALSPPLRHRKTGKKIGGRKSSLFFFCRAAGARTFIHLHGFLFSPTHAHKQHKKQSRSLSHSLIRSELSAITMYSSSSFSFSLSFPRALKASRKTKSRERRITPRSKKMSNRCFVNFAANGDDDDRAMVAAEQIATSKSTIDSSKVDFAMPNRLLSSDLTTVRFSFSQSVYKNIRV